MMRIGRAIPMALIAAALTANVSLYAAVKPAAAAAPPAQAVKAPVPQPARIVELTLSGTLIEHPADFSLSLFNIGAPKAPALSDLIVTLDKATKDPAVGGIFLNLKSFGLNLAQAQEIGELLTNARHAHKRVIVFSNDFDTPTYLLASYADTVIMPANGNVMIPGVRLELMFWKGLFDKIGVQADMIQIGKYKGAKEPFMNTQASPEFAGDINNLVDALYGDVVSGIAANRQMPAAAIKKAIDEGWMDGQRAKALNLVDQLMDRREVDAWMDDQFPHGSEMVTDYDQVAKPKINFNNPFAIFQMLGTPKASHRTSQPAIAVIYADGVIMDDQPGAEARNNVVTPATIRKAVDKAVDDPLVKAIVLRIDSPGGSAAASDEIWQTLKGADKHKPVTVSMGHMAASGGYYIACAGRSITADPATITGSIGVVGGKFVIHDLLQKIGVNVEPFSRGKHADMFSSQTPFNKEETAFVRNLMEKTYAQFTARVQAGRGNKIKKIADVAQGRIFDGVSAISAGLVDRTGTLNDTIVAAATKAHIAKNYQILVYPEAKDFADVLRESFGIETRLPSQLSLALKVMPSRYRNAVMDILEMTQSLQHEHLLLAMPAQIVEGD